MHEPQAGALAAVAALDEPTRRRLYDYVVRQPGPVSRDDVAAALSVPRPTVAFHLDRLVDAQLLAVGHERRTGRTGPGAGRPAKLYRRSDRRVTVSLPERDYELAGHLLATAVEEAGETGGSAREILALRARELGERRGPPRPISRRRSRRTGSSPGPRKARCSWGTARSTGWPGHTRNWSAR